MRVILEKSPWRNENPLPWDWYDGPMGQRRRTGAFTPELWAGAIVRQFQESTVLGALLKSTTRP